MRKVKNYTMAALILGMSLSLTACGDAGGKNGSPDDATAQATEAATEAPKEIIDSELYDSFSNNEAKVLYRGGEGIRTATLFPLGQALEEGQSYTINQIVFLLKNLPSIPDTFEPDIKYERIDCGQDGVQELLVDMVFGSSEMYMIIKDIDGELVLCYAEEFLIQKMLHLII